MALSLEDALGHRPETLEDFVLARILFPLVKHMGEELSREELEDKADKELNYMSNLELLDCISMALEDMKEAKKEAE